MMAHKQIINAYEKEGAYTQGEYMIKYELVYNQGQVTYKTIMQCGSDSASVYIGGFASGDLDGIQLTIKTMFTQCEH